MVVGPTAVGKSRLGIDLALEIRGEVIGVDSIQVYNGLHIASGKVTTQETKLVPHHLLSICPPHEQYSVLQFQTDATTSIAQIESRGNTPILVGGTFYWLDALLWENLLSKPIVTNKLPTTPLAVIHETKLTEPVKTESLWEQLNRVDPQVQNDFS